MTFTTPNVFACICPMCSQVKPLPCLPSPREFRHWRDGLVRKGLAPSTVNRTCAAFQAALALAAAQDPRITNQSAWRTGRAALPDAEQSRNVILPEDAVLSIISAAYAVSRELGCWSRSPPLPVRGSASSPGWKSGIRKAIVPIPGS